MPKTREQKAATVAELVKEFKAAKAAAFVNYQGLTVAQADELRKKAREVNVHYTVAKKTLMDRAAKEAGYDIKAREFPGMIGAAFSIEDEVAPAKVLGDMSKKSTIKLVGGIFEGAVVAADKVIALSKLPGKKELLGMFVSTLNGVPAAFVRALNAIREKLDTSASSGQAVRTSGRQDVGTQEANPAPVAAPVAAVSQALAPDAPVA